MGRSDWYKRGSCWHSEGPWQAGETGWQEPHEAKQEVQSPTAGEEQPQAPVEAGGWPAGKQLCRKEPGSPGGDQIEHEPTMCPCHEER